MTPLEITTFVISILNIISNIFLHFRHSTCSAGCCMCDLNDNQDQDN